MSAVAKVVQQGLVGDLPCLAIPHVQDIHPRSRDLVPLGVVGVGLALAEEDLSVCGALGTVTGRVLPYDGEESGHGGNTAGLL